MIVVRVELWSARTHAVTELARMEISNNGQGTATHGTYIGQTYVGRSAAALSRRTVFRSGQVEHFPRRDSHVWNLIARMLTTMGYGA